MYNIDIEWNKDGSFTLKAGMKTYLMQLVAATPKAVQAMIDLGLEPNPSDMPLTLPHVAQHEATNQEEQG